MKAVKGICSVFPLLLPSTRLPLFTLSLNHLESQLWVFFFSFQGLDKVFYSKEHSSVDPSHTDVPLPKAELHPCCADLFTG